MNANRPLRLAVVAAMCGGIAFLWAAQAARAGDTRPNVVIVLADDQGYGDLGYHGNPVAATPHLDAFAAEAIELTSFHVSPVCAPTRASLMTGRYHFRGGVADVFGKAANLDPAEVTLAEALARSGYATGVFGKWHLGDEGAHAPASQGFEQSLVFRGAAMRAAQYFNPTLLQNGQPQQFRGYCLDVFTEAAIEFIRANRQRPFFVYLASNLVHTPLEVPAEWAEPFRQRGVSESTARVYGMLKNVDDNFGRLRAALAQLGIEENTLLIYTSDNGPCSGSVPTDRFHAGLHGLKGTVYENGIRVPCFMRWPRGLAGPRRIGRLTAHIDIMPTVLNACGVASPDGVKFDGRSMLPFLRHPKAAWPARSIFTQWDSGQTPRRGHAYAVITERYKLVQPVGMDSPQQQHIRDRYRELCRLEGRGDRSVEGEPRLELYDLAADPGEQHDLAAEHPGVVAQLEEEYQQWFSDVTRFWQSKTSAEEN